MAPPSAPARVRLSLNVDHVATLRQARRAPYPDPVAAARLAEEAGAAGITAHVRADRRHIQDADALGLRAAVRGKLNLELAATPEMMAVALAVRPDQVTLVPERPEEVTTEGGLDLVRQGDAVAVAAALLVRQGIAVSAFIDPDERQIEALARLAAEVGGGGAGGGEARGVNGVELNTDAYTKASLAGDARAPAAPASAAGGVGGELDKLRAAAALVCERGFHLYAGHGLTVANVGPVAALPGMEELNIGHALIARAVMIGVPAAVREMLAAMGSAG